MILPADKGNAMVVLDRSTYKQNMKEIIDDTGTYCKLKKDPTTCIEKKVSEAIREIHRQGRVSDKLKDTLSPSYSNPSQI